MFSIWVCTYPLCPDEKMEVVVPPSKDPPKCYTCGRTMEKKE